MDIFLMIIVGVIVWAILGWAGVVIINNVYYAFNKVSRAMIGGSYHSGGGDIVAGVCLGGFTFIGGIGLFIGKIIQRAAYHQFGNTKDGWKKLFGVKMRDPDFSDRW